MILVLFRRFFHISPFLTSTSEGIPFSFLFIHCYWTKPTLPNFPFQDRHHLCIADQYSYTNRERKKRMPVLFAIALHSSSFRARTSILQAVLFSFYLSFNLSLLLLLLSFHSILVTTTTSATTITTI